MDPFATYSAFVATYSAFVATYSAFDATYSASVATYSASIATYSAFVATYSAFVSRSVSGFFDQNQKSRLAPKNIPNGYFYKKNSTAELEVQFIVFFIKQ